MRSDSEQRAERRRGRTWSAGARGRWEVPGLSREESALRCVLDAAPSGVRVRRRNLTSSPSGPFSKGHKQQHNDNVTNGRQRSLRELALRPLASTQPYMQRRETARSEMRNFTQKCCQERPLDNAFKHFVNEIQDT